MAGTIPTFPTVRPGDLIRASDMMLVFSALEDLETRVAALEGGTTAAGISISSISPPGQIQIGSTIDVFGADFGYSSGTARAYFAFNNTQTQVPSFLVGTSDSDLRFVVPTINGVQTTGSPAQLVVSNATGSASVNVTLVPAPLPQAGNIDITPMGVSPLTILAGQVADFMFTARSRATQNANLTITPTITIASNQAAWLSAMTVLDGTKAPLTNNILPLQSGQTVTFYVRITSVPAQPANATFQLGVIASAPGTGGSSTPVSYTVGTASTPPDTTFTLVYDSVQGGSVQAPIPPATESTLLVSSSGSALVKFLATFTVAGTYQVTAQPLGTTTGWTFTIHDPPGTPQYVIAAGDLSQNGFATRNPSVVVTPSNTATSPGEFQITVQRQGATGNQTYRMQIQTQ